MCQNRDAVYLRTLTCASCYSSARNWWHKSPSERAARLERLSLYRRRVDDVERGAFVIGAPKVYQTGSKRGLRISNKRRGLHDKVKNLV